ncbi:MAG: exosortase H [Acidobacteriota bacterium]
MSKKSRSKSKPSAKSSASAAESSASQPAAEESNAEPESFWRARRQEITFLTVFILILGGGFTLISLNWVDSNVIAPFTGGVAKASGVALNLIGQDIEMQGTVIRNNRFAVNIMNGCNGVETMIIFLGAVLAFPASWKARGIGLVLGLIAIQFVNLIRVVALFLTGAYYPKFFDSSHTVVWQTIVILFGVVLWIFWANRYAAPKPALAD